MADFFVRSGMVLHRQVEQMVKGNKIKVNKLYQEGQKVEGLTDKELRQYQHLIESEEQVNSRQPKTTTKKSGDK